MVETDPDFSITPQDVRSRPFQMEFPRDQAGLPLPLELTLSVTSPDFEPKEQSKIVLVSSDRDSQAYTFLLTPQHLGELRLTLEVRLGSLHIASKIIKTHAERSERITGGQAILGVHTYPGAGGHPGARGRTNGPPSNCWRAYDHL